MAHYPKLTLEAHLSSEELQQRYRACTDAASARRWQALWLFSLNHPLGTVASLVSLHCNTLRKLIARYNQHGPDAVADGRASNPGRQKVYLTQAQEDELRAALLQPHPHGGVWTSTRVAAWIGARTGRSKVYPQYGWYVMRRLGFTPQVPRPRHRQAATPDQQEAWKKN
jgi:transposase